MSTTVGKTRPSHVVRRRWDGTSSLKGHARNLLTTGSDEEKRAAERWFREKRRPYPGRARIGRSTNPPKHGCAMRGTMRKAKKKGGKGK